jgi:hypothetical protein
MAVLSRRTRAYDAFIATTNWRNIMFEQIIRNTPTWVWGLLLGLLSLGISQSFSRTVGLRRVTVMSLAMAGLSLFGTVSAFGSASQVLLTWLAAAIGVAAFVLSRPLAVSTTYDPATRRFYLPGSWVPLGLMMGIFFTKYVVGVTLAMQPALVHQSGPALAAAALYGAFSGAFVARAARLLRLALRVQAGPNSAAQAAGNV